MPRFLDAVEPLGIDAEGKGVTEGNCKIEVEDIGQGQQLVVLSATKDLKEGRGNHFVEGWDVLLAGKSANLEVLGVCI